MDNDFYNGMTKHYAQEKEITDRLKYVTDKCIKTNSKFKTIKNFVLSFIFIYLMLYFSIILKQQWSVNILVFYLILNYLSIVLFKINKLRDAYIELYNNTWHINDVIYNSMHCITIAVLVGAGWFFSASVLSVYFWNILSLHADAKYHKDTNK